MPTPTKHVVFNSGGIGSYIVAKRVAERYGTEHLIHLFTDTKSEDEDLYRFLRETTKAIGGEVAWLADGRSLWELFRDERMIGNNRFDICSKKLKREVGDRYIRDRFPGGRGCVLYFGIDHAERERFYGDDHKLGIRRRWLPYACEAPLCDPPYLSKCDMLKECERDGFDPPRMYDEGFPHNNCGGFCVKAGHAQFAHLLKTRPYLFAYHAEEERKLREYLGHEWAVVLKDRTGGTTKPLPMLEFRRRVESGEMVVNPRDWGEGCRCMVNADD